MRETFINQIAKEVSEIAKENETDLGFETAQFGNIVVSELHKAFVDKYGFVLSEKELPQVLVVPNRQTPSFLKEAEIKGSGEKVEPNCIIIRGLEDALSGNTMSEELAHFYRHKLQPKDENIEHITEEFFGFLGRRLFEKIVMEGNLDLADLEDHDREVGSKGEALNLLNGLQRLI